MLLDVLTLTKDNKSAKQNCSWQLAELQKRANRANQLVLFFSAGANFWAILGHFGPFWQFGPFFGANFLAILGRFWAILAILGNFWANLGNLGSFLGYFG